MTSMDCSQSSPVKACNVCGDVGFNDCLAICCQCKGAEHLYCMQTLVDTTPSDWICEECKLEGSKIRDSHRTRTLSCMKSRNNNRTSHVHSKPLVTEDKRPLNSLKEIVMENFIEYDTSKSFNGAAECLESMNNTDCQHSIHNSHPNSKAWNGAAKCSEDVRSSSTRCGRFAAQGGCHVSNAEGPKDNTAGAKSCSHKGVPKGTRRANAHALSTVPSQEAKDKHVSFLLPSQSEGSLTSRTEKCPEDVTNCNQLGTQETCHVSKSYNCKFEVLAAAKGVRQSLNESMPQRRHTFKKLGLVDTLERQQQDQLEKFKMEHKGGNLRSLNRFQSQSLLGRPPSGISSFPNRTEKSRKRKILPGPNDAQLTHKHKAYPEDFSLWSGCFNVFSCAGSRRCYYGMQAHPSSMADPKASAATQTLPFMLQLEELQRSAMWPTAFQDRRPDTSNIGIFFFPMDQTSNDMWYVPLLLHLTSHDLTLRARLSCVELLIFSSVLVKEGEQYWHGRPFLWGVFKANTSIPTHLGLACFIPFTSDVTIQTFEKECNSQVLNMDIDMISGREVLGMTDNGTSCNDSALPPLPPGPPPTLPSPPPTPPESQYDAINLSRIIPALTNMESDSSSGITCQNAGVLVSGHGNSGGLKVALQESSSTEAGFDGLNSARLWSDAAVDTDQRGKCVLEMSLPTTKSLDKSHLEPEEHQDEKSCNKSVSGDHRIISGDTSYVFHGTIDCESGPLLSRNVSSDICVDLEHDFPNSGKQERNEQLAAKGHSIIDLECGPSHKRNRSSEACADFEHDLPNHREQSGLEQLVAKSHQGENVNDKKELSNKSICESDLKVVCGTIDHAHGLSMMPAVKRVVDKEAEWDASGRERESSRCDGFESNHYACHNDVPLYQKQKQGCRNQRNCEINSTERKCLTGDESQACYCGYISPLEDALPNTSSNGNDEKSLAGNEACRQNHSCHKAIHVNDTQDTKDEIDPLTVGICLPLFPAAEEEPYSLALVDKLERPWNVLQVTERAANLELTLLMPQYRKSGNVWSKIEDPTDPLYDWNASHSIIG